MKIELRTEGHNTKALWATVEGYRFHIEDQLNSYRTLNEPYVKEDVVRNWIESALEIARFNKDNRQLLTILLSALDETERDELHDLLIEDINDRYEGKYQLVCNKIYEDMQDKIKHELSF